MVWECLLCGTENPDEEEICQGCGALKDESSYDAVIDEEPD